MFIAAWRRFLRSWNSQAHLQIATLSVLTGSFTVIVMTWTVYVSMASGLKAVAQQLEVVAYLEEEILPEDRDLIVAKIKSMDNVVNVDLVTSEEALSRFKEHMGDQLPEGIFTNDDSDLLPSSLEIELAHDALAKEKDNLIKTLTNQIKNLPGIADVSFGFSWASQFSNLTRAFRLSGFGLFLLLIGGAILVIGNSVNQSIYQRRDEIEILELFGATRSSILGPIVFEGVGIGLIAGLLALSISALTVNWLKVSIEPEISFLSQLSAFRVLGWKESITIALCCAGFSGLGAYLSARKITTGWAAAQRGAF